jgi:two-component system, LytTR family, sensor histidine kinase LytS
VLEPGSAKGLGIALRNVDDRLKGHFGPGSGVVVESVEGVGTTVTLVLAGVAAHE